jgi:pyruvate/2-oxoglutarate dehydrogenase complex dihydrolipoamide dehydrogenase (E3) component
MEVGMTKFDAIVIGTGQAGPYLARRMAGRGMRVAIIERGHFGGTCINTGCTPTKALVASAYAAHLARRSADFGVTITGAIGVDMQRVKARKDAIVGVSSRAVENSLRSAANITVVQGHARFVSAHEVAVGDALFDAERIFVNVGARPSVPPIPGLDGVPYLTSSSILHLDSVPRHLVVIGGSYVGLEFAQMYRRFGSAVTVVEFAPRLIAREDPEISDSLRGILRAEDIDVRLGARTTSVSRSGDSVVATVEDASGRTTIEGSHLLMAAGRRPNTDDLGVDRAGVALDRRGYIQVDDTLRTNVAGIWAMGECNGRGAFTHTAWNDSEIVGGNLLDGEARSTADRITAYALYTDPPLGRAGMTETEARAAGHKVLVGAMAMENVSRAYEKDETLGLMKIVVDGDTKQILGAAILGVGGDEAVHCVLDLMYAKAPYTLLQRAMHIHPTVCEFIPDLLDDLQAR